MSKYASKFTASQEIRNWSTEEVASLLRKNDLAECADLFKTMAINGETLMGLNEVHLNRWRRELGYNKMRILARLLEDIKNNPENFVTYHTMKTKNTRQNFDATPMGLRKTNGDETPKLNSNESTASAFRPPISVPTETPRFDRSPAAIPNENNYRSRPPVSIPEKPQLRARSPAAPTPGKINFNWRAPPPAPEEPKNRSRSPAPVFASQLRQFPPASDLPQFPSRPPPSEGPPVTEVPFSQSQATEVQTFLPRPPVPDVPFLQTRSPTLEKPVPQRPIAPENLGFQSRAPAPAPPPKQENDDDDYSSWGSDFDDDIGSDSDNCYGNFNNDNNNNNNNNDEMEVEDQPEYYIYDEKDQNEPIQDQYLDMENKREDPSLPKPPPRSTKPSLWKNTETSEETLTPSLPNRPSNLPLKNVSGFPLQNNSNFALPPAKPNFEQNGVHQSQLPQPPGPQFGNLDIYFPTSLQNTSDANDEEPDYYESVDLENPYKNNTQSSQPPDGFRRDQTVTQNSPSIPQLPSSMLPKRNQSQLWQVVEQQNAILDSPVPQISMPNKIEPASNFLFHNQTVTQRKMTPPSVPTMPSQVSRAPVENASGFEEEVYDVINESLPSDEYYLTPTPHGPEIASSINNQLPDFTKAPLGGHASDLTETSRPVLPLPQLQQQPRDGVFRNLIPSFRSHSKPSFADKEISSPPDIGSGKKPAPPPSSSSPGGSHVPKPLFSTPNPNSHDSIIGSTLNQRPLPPPPDEKVITRQPIPPSGPPPGSRHSTKANNARNGPQPPSSHTLQAAAWYHHLDRRRAEEALRALGEDGCFMVRPSSLTNNPLTLTLLFKGRLFNIPIRKRLDGLYALGSEKHNELVYPTVEALIHNYFTEKLALYSCGEKSGRTSLTVTPPKRS